MNSKLRYQNDDRIIQSIESNENSLCIVCFSKQQAQRFIKEPGFLTDATYQRVHGEINELVFAAWDNKAQIGVSDERDFESLKHKFFARYLLADDDAARVMKS